ncbi:ribosomal protein L1p/L10e family-domain-containing protein [Tricladium varicosporioides]|nr:ribosomal protein L1p/L10e family-domain-containing protein [Hymenoscyphus varicosporioides]
MAPKSTALTVKVDRGSPYQLNDAQVLKASKALLKYMGNSKTEAAVKTEKKSLLEDADEEETSEPVWLILSTKKHIVDKKRLKPARIATPHSLNSSPSSTICLITADPQRTYKDLVASPAFPVELSSRINRVVGINKIKKKWTQYEAQRKLKAESDIFLADDRIIVGLPKLLGKTLYKGTSKRPLPINISTPAPRADGKRVTRTKGDDPRGPAEPKTIAKEIERALEGTLVHLSPSASTSVKVGYASWDAKKLAENVEAVANALIDKHVPQKWRNVKGLHIKGEHSAALPIWLADELWVDENDVLNEQEAQEITANVGRKRKAIEGDYGNKRKATEVVVEEKTEKVKAKKQKLIESNDDNLDKEIAKRKETLRKQKEEAAEDVVDEVPKPSKKTKQLRKGKGVVKA